MEFTQLALLIGLAAIFGVAAKVFKQPLLIGFLLAGLILGITGVISDPHEVENLGKIGVALLLFLLGLEMKLGELPSLGKVALSTGLGQILFTSTVGFLLASLLGFGTLSAVYIAVALTFSSTIIMVKLLSEKKDLTSLYGKIAIGFLLVQDFVAIVILMFLASLGSGGLGVLGYLLIAAKALLLFAVIWVLSKKILPPFFERIVADNPELLFIVSIAWALGVASIVAGPLGFTLEIGGFLAGIALSNLPEHLQIASRARPLRDFFLTLFFLYLGTLLVIGDGLSQIILPAVIFALLVLIGNPLIVLTILGFLGYKRRTSFMAGLTVAQIGEFSFIFMAMGATLGHIGQREVATIVLVGVFTMTVSTYAILGSEKLYKLMQNKLGIFERKFLKERAFSKERHLKDHVVLIGCDRTGKVLAAHLKRKEIPFLVVDFNPTVYTRLTAENIPVIFGDINDPEIMEDADMADANLVISTISCFEDNMILLEYIRSLEKRPQVIVRSLSRREAVKLYEAQATYVVVPEVLAGEHVKHLLESHRRSDESFEKMGNQHFKRLLFS
jgi:Kef-type K+ transport system membrane component KefB